MSQKTLVDTGRDNQLRLVRESAAARQGSILAKTGSEVTGNDSDAKRASGKIPGLPDFGILTELDLEYDEKLQALWCFQQHNLRPNFTPELIADICHVQTTLESVKTDDRASAAFDNMPRYLVWASRKQNIFNLGGDLSYFVELITNRDRDGIMQYAKSCVDICYKNYLNLDLPMITIALVQGDALGGGFESALSSDIIIAERSAQFGLPEILFGLFPGMGAYSFLSRRIGTVAAEKMIFSGRLYRADELYQMGLIEVLAEDGKGEESLYDYLRKNRKRFDSHRNLYNIRRRYNPVTLPELMDITERWTETAMGLSETGIRKMRRLAKAQMDRSDGREINNSNQKAFKMDENISVFSEPVATEGTEPAEPRTSRQEPQSMAAGNRKTFNIPVLSTVARTDNEDKTAPNPETRRFNSVYERILDGVADARAAATLQPSVERLLSEGMSRSEYLDFLEQLYHIVWHFCPTMAAAAARCGDDKRALRYALYHDIQEEKGHETWVLNDIKNMGGDTAAITKGHPEIPVQAMIGYNYFVAERKNPYGVLGMLHVLEEISANYSSRVAVQVARRLDIHDGSGFSFLGSHGVMDMDHVNHFKTLVNGISRDEDIEAIIESSRVNYALFGALFREA